MNRHCCIPICYFPSTVVFVDDSKDFLINFSRQLDDRLFYRLFDSPYDALEAIHLVKETPALSTDNLFRTHEAFLATLPLPISGNQKFTSFQCEIFNPNRFKEISVVVVDYAMPGLNGLQFCEHVKNNQVKKILLTGKSDQITMQKATEEGVIDYYFFKSDANIHVNLSNAIQTLQFTYFKNVSDLLLTILNAFSIDPVFDNKFAFVFNDIINKYRINEYYCLDHTGSYLLLDESARAFIMLVRNEHQLQEDIASLEKIKAPASVKTRLMNGDHLIAPGYQASTQDWSQYLHAATTFQCQQPFSVSVYEEPMITAKLHNKFMPYQAFLLRENALCATNETS